MMEDHSDCGPGAPCRQVLQSVMGRDATRCVAGDSKKKEDAPKGPTVVDYIKTPKGLANYRRTLVELIRRLHDDGGLTQFELVELVLVETSTER